jgi:hypothetical protein
MRTCAFTPLCQRRTSGVAGWFADTGRGLSVRATFEDLGSAILHEDHCCKVLEVAISNI